MSERQAKLIRRKHMLLTKGGDLTTAEVVWLLEIENQLHNLIA